jgi:hypothetical protein
MFTICPFVEKMRNFFLFLDRECISEPVKCFLSQNDQMGSLLLFYIGNILVDKNIICNGCFLTGFWFYSESSSNMDGISFHALCLITSF